MLHPHPTRTNQVTKGRNGTSVQRYLYLSSNNKQVWLVDKCVLKPVYASEASNEMRLADPTEHATPLHRVDVVFSDRHVFKGPSFFFSVVL